MVGKHKKRIVIVQNTERSISNQKQMSHLRRHDRDAPLLRLWHFVAARVARQHVRIDVVFEVGGKSAAGQRFDPGGRVGRGKG